MKKQCVAMLLAGGKGDRLSGLTKHMAKPAVSFGENTGLLILRSATVPIQA